MDRGGIETMLMNHYRRIDRSKIQFDFLVHGERHGEYEDEIRALGGRIHRIRKVKTPLDLWLWQKELYTLFKKEKYKIVHAHLEQETRLIMRQAERAGVQCRISHSHNTSSCRPLLKKAVGKIIEILTPWACTDFFACSILAGKWQFGETIVKDPRFKLFKNAVDCAKFKFSETRRKEMRESLQLSQNQITICHVGRFSEQKNHLFLIDIFHKLTLKKTNAVLLLIGDGPMRQKNSEKISTLGLESNVHFLGLRNDVDAIMQASDVFCLPSLYEGLPVAAVEAQSAGLPCLLSDTITPEVEITDLLHYLPLNASPEIWADALIQKASIPHRDTYREMSGAGWDIVENTRWLENFYLKNGR